MKAMCFLMSADQNMYIFIFMLLRCGDNVGRGKYPGTTTSALYILICTEGVICGNQKYTNRKFQRQRWKLKKGCIGHTVAQLQQGGTEENSTLVPRRDGTNLNATYYNCQKPVYLAYNCSEAGWTGTCSLQVIHSFVQNKRQQNEPIIDNLILLYTCSLDSVLKYIFDKKCPQV